MEDSPIYHALTGMAMQLPSMLTMLGGIIVAAIRWKRHPRVSLTVVISLALMIVHVILFAVVFASIGSILTTENIRTMQTFQTVASVAYNITLAILTAILLAAIFMRRTRSPESLPPVALARAA